MVIPSEISQHPVCTIRMVGSIHRKINGLFDTALGISRIIHPFALEFTQMALASDEESLLSIHLNLEFAVGNETATTNVQLSGGWSDSKNKCLIQQIPFAKRL